MYLDAEARFEINGELGESFIVSKGVAQGCVLSPLFFAIYIDDLLEELRESGLSIAVGMALLNAFSFAEDLTLIAVDEFMVQEFLGILARWCKRNDFEINMDKNATGIMRVGGDPNDPPPVFYFNGLPLRVLEKFKYLGFLLSLEGSWDKFIDMICQRARGVLAQASHFFQSKEISFALKVKVAKSLILSTLVHGQDIIGLTPAQENKLEKTLAAILRTSFDQPYSTKVVALRVLSGLPSMSSIFLSRRVQNYIRIRNLPGDRSINQFLHADEFNTPQSTLGTYKVYLRVIRKAQRYSSVSESQLEKCVSSYSKSSCKRIIGRIVSSKDRISSRRQIRNSHVNSLLRIFNSFTFHPVLTRSGSVFSCLITWMLAATDIYKDKCNQKRFEYTELVPSV